MLIGRSPASDRHGQIGFNVVAQTVTMAVIEIPTGSRVTCRRRGSGEV
jgi:hypothetical protein